MSGLGYRELPRHLTPDEFRDLADEADTLLELARNARVSRTKAGALADAYADDVEFPNTGPETLGRRVNSEGWSP